MLHCKSILTWIHCSIMSVKYAHFLYSVHNFFISEQINVKECY